MCVYWYGDSELRVIFFSETIQIPASPTGMPMGSEIYIDFLIENCDPEKRDLKEINAVYPRQFEAIDTRYDLEFRQEIRTPTPMLGAYFRDLSGTFPINSSRPGMGDDQTDLNKFYYNSQVQCIVEGDDFVVSIPDMNDPWITETLRGNRQKHSNNLILKDIHPVLRVFLADHGLAIFTCTLSEPLAYGNRRWFRWHFKHPLSGRALTGTGSPDHFSLPGGKRFATTSYQILGPYCIPRQVITPILCARASTNEIMREIGEVARQLFWEQGIASFGEPTVIERGWITISPSDGSYIDDLFITGAAYLANYGPRHISKGISYQIKSGDTLFPEGRLRKFPVNPNLDDPRAFPVGPPVPNDGYGRYIISFNSTRIGNGIE